MVSQEIQQKIEAMKAEITQLEATAHREDLNRGVKKNLSDDDLYPFAKAFTNHIERQRKIANLEEARKVKAEKQEEPKAPVQ